MMFRKALLIAVAVMLLAVSAVAENTVDLIMNTRTTQAFSDEAVSVDGQKVINQARLSTASAINQQPWFFVAVTNQEVMKEIASSGMGFAPPAGTPGKPEGAPQDGNGASPAAPPASNGPKAGLGDSPAAILIYRSDASKSPNADFDCGLAAQNMVIAASALGYSVKIISSPTMALNGENHDALCEKLGVDTSMQAVAVLLLGHADSSVDVTSQATTRESFETKTNIIE
ncbi:MAG: nitroreductase family protein [Clostridia bacterium]|nr:nitroreductase family protein [Clostridia bacterium]